MENLYPLFEQNRILKKEYLWALRDYSFGQVQLMFQKYNDGIICGCDLSVEDNKLVIGSGIVKNHDFIYLITRSQSVYIEALDQLMILKISTEKKVQMNQLQYQINFFLDSDMKKEENELEICRFHLRQGATLRLEYKSFADLDTKYDTVNFTESDWSCFGGTTISPFITDYFSEIILSMKKCESEDLNFAYLCMNSMYTVSGKILHDYITRRLKIDRNIYLGKRELYKGLENVISSIPDLQGSNEKKNRSRHRIIID